MKKNTFLVSIVVLLILLVAALFVRTKKSQELAALHPSPSPAQQTSGKGKTLLTIPAQAAQNFYHAYENCIKNPPDESLGQDADYCQDNNPYASQKLGVNLDRGGVAQKGADPVMCSQNPPAGYEIKGATEPENGRSTATVEETFGAGTPVTITVDLVQEQEEWKVDNVHCPNP